MFNKKLKDQIEQEHCDNFQYRKRIYINEQAISDLKDDIDRITSINSQLTEIIAILQIPLQENTKMIKLLLDYLNIEKIEKPAKPEKTYLQTKQR